MNAIGITPTRVYNVGNRHWRQTSSNPVTPRDRVVEKQSAKIEVLNKEISECKRVNQKLTMIAKWNVRATQSALKNSQDMLEILEDLYGDSATE
jgi:hypothetical protein